MIEWKTKVKNHTKLSRIFVFLWFLSLEDKSAQ